MKMSEIMSADQTVLHEWSLLVCLIKTPQKIRFDNGDKMMPKPHVLSVIFLLKTMQCLKNFI